MAKLDLNEQNTFKHPAFKEAENKSVTDVRYEAPRPATNEYDVELYKLQLEQWRENKPLRYIGTIGTIGILGVFGIWLLKELFGKDS